MENAQENKFLNFIKKNYLAVNLSILAVLFFINCFTQHAIWVVFPILLCFLMFGKLEDSYSYLLFSTPFCFVGGYTGLTVFFVVCGLFFIKYFCILVKQKNKLTKSQTIVLLIFLVYMVIPIGGYNINFLYRFVGIMLVLFTIWVLVNQPEILNVKKNIRIFSLAVIISALFSLLYFVSPYLQSSMMLNQEDGFIRFQALIGHPNTFALLCVIAMAILAHLFIQKPNWVDGVLFVLLALLGFLTLSKMYIILFAVIMLFVLIWLFKINWKKALIVVAVLLAGVGVVAIIKPSIFTTIIHRFIGKGTGFGSFRDFMNAITTLRYDLWINYLSFMGTHPLRLIFGCGIGANVIDPLSPHNAYISMVYQLGIVGTALFVAVIVLLFKSNKSKEKKKFQWSLLIPIIVLALICCIDDLVFHII